MPNIAIQSGRNRGSFRGLLLAFAAYAAFAVAAVALLGGCSKSAASESKLSYEFATVKRSSVSSFVSSSGTLSPLSEVSVMAEMSGRVEKVFVDYNDKVAKGQVLALLNTDLLELQRKEALAEVRKARAAYELQALDERNKAKLFEKGLVSDYENKTSKATLESCAASLASAESALEVIELKLGSYARVVSPIDGIVLDRNVDVGQGVVEGSSSNSSSLFTLAKDLSRMEIKAEVDELDIASIKVGQEARFTVEACPGLSFKGSVREIRLVPESSDNVVSYCVMVAADNKEGRLFPGMTADIEFVKESREGVLVVPNAALKFTPPGLSEEEVARLVFAAGLSGLGEAERAEALSRYDEAAKAAKDAAAASGGQAQAGGLAGMVMQGPGPGGPPGMRGRATAKAGSSGQAAGFAAGAAGPEAGGLSGAAAELKRLWYLDGSGAFGVILVEAGASDGTYTEVSSDAELEGRKVVLKARAE